MSFPTLNMNSLYLVVITSSRRVYILTRFGNALTINGAVLSTKVRTNRLRTNLRQSTGVIRRVSSIRRRQLTKATRTTNVNRGGTLQNRVRNRPLGSTLVLTRQYAKRDHAIASRRRFINTLSLRMSTRRLVTSIRTITSRLANGIFVNRNYSRATSIPIVRVNRSITNVNHRASTLNVNNRNLLVIIIAINNYRYSTLQRRVLSSKIRPKSLQYRYRGARPPTTNFRRNVYHLRACLQPTNASTFFANTIRPKTFTISARGNYAILVALFYRLYRHASKVQITRHQRSIRNTLAYRPLRVAFRKYSLLFVKNVLVRSVVATNTIIVDVGGTKSSPLITMFGNFKINHVFYGNDSLTTFRDRRAYLKTFQHVGTIKVRFRGSILLLVYFLFYGVNRHPFRPLRPKRVRCVILYATNVLRGGFTFFRSSATRRRPSKGRHRRVPLPLFLQMIPIVSLVLQRRATRLFHHLFPMLTIHRHRYQTTNRVIRRRGDYHD